MLTGITRTGFSDDDSIPMWTKPYVSTALMTGIITGFKNDDGMLVFASQEPITYNEAAVVLNNMLKITDVVTVTATEQTTCPVWSYQAEQNLAACHVMPSMGTECGSLVTRADAAAGEHHGNGHQAGAVRLAAFEKCENSLASVHYVPPFILAP
jgi:hypothetical protein